MERLKSVYLLAIIVLEAGPAVCQQPRPNDPRAGSVVVIGDVERCQTYPIPIGSTLTVRQAVLNAGLLSDIVKVTVIRSSQDRAQWTQVISATSADSVERVKNGDVLVVQSMSPLTAGVKSNAALRTDTGVDVVGLEEDGIVIGDVLKATNNLSLADGQLKVICRFQGQSPITKAELYHPIAHGDVISISRGNRTTLNGFGSMLPSVSEWKSSSAAETQDSFIPNAEPSNNSPFSSSEPTSQPFRFPSPTTGPMLLPIQEAATPEAEVAEGEDDADISAIVVPAFTISQSEDVADAAAADSHVNSASDTSTVAPIAPQEMQIDAVNDSTSTAFNPWNFVFIGGLLLAGTLILAGTLKPEPDDNTEFSHDASRTTNLNAVPTPQRKFTESPRKPNLVPPATETAMPSVVIESEIGKAAAAEPAKALVAGHEWFSGDWHGPVDTSNLQQRDESSVSYSATSSSSSKDVEAVIDDAGFSDLEDLLQNRLPIDLFETQLPLRVVLFGKPAGPRRLRIDAAHSTVPAPHMNSAANTRREQPVAATTAAAPHTQTVVDSSGCLDRALHFLQERTES